MASERQVKLIPIINCYFFIYTYFSSYIYIYFLIPVKYYVNNLGVF